VEREIRQETAGALSTLSPLEEKVVRMKFGIGYSREHSSSELANHFSISRERIRQIEAKALGRLRNSSVIPRLRSMRQQCGSEALLEPGLQPELPCPN
jgi:RNA polymerase primary sigma factor